MSTNEPIDVEVSQSESTAMAVQLTPGMQLMRVEMDAVRSMCIAKPRDIASVVKSIETTLRAYPKMAGELRYVKPVGWRTIAICTCGKQYIGAGFKWWEGAKSKLNNCPSCGKLSVARWWPEQEFARGLNIKAAEFIAAELPYCRTEVDVEPTSQADLFRVTAKFFDVQQGRFNTRTALVSRFAKKGQSYERIEDDRFFNLVIPGAQSRLLREMIVRAAPFVVRHVMQSTVDEILDTALSPEDVQKIVDGFERHLKISLAQLEAVLGLPKDEWTQTQYATARDLFRSIKDKETTIEECLAASDFERQSTTATTRNDGTEPTVPKTLDDLKKPAETTTTTPKKPPKGGTKDEAWVAFVHEVENSTTAAQLDAIKLPDSFTDEQCKKGAELIEIKRGEL